MSLTKAQDELKHEFVSELGGGAWNDGWESLLKLSPDMFRASMKLSSVPKKKSHLSPKIQKLISIAVDSASTHLYVPGIQTHIKAALQEGATPAEIMEVIELTSTLGIHACNIGVPLLVEVMKEEGIYDQHPTTVEAPQDENRKRLRDEFTKKRGYWHDFWEDFLRLDPEFFGSYLEFSSVPWVENVKGDNTGGGLLEPKVREISFLFIPPLFYVLVQRVLRLYNLGANIK